MDGRRSATAVTLVVVVLVLPGLMDAMLSCKDRFSLRTDSTFSQECDMKQWWHAVEQSKAPGMCLQNLQMSTSRRNNALCRESRRRREAVDAKGHVRDKKILCSETPATPTNMMLMMSADGFLGTCREGYGFASPFIQPLDIRCQAGEWVKSHAHPCLPQCSNQCHNGGTCVDVDTCLCPPGTEGSTCSTVVLDTCRTDVKWHNVIVKAILEGLFLQCPRGYKQLQQQDWLLQCKASGFEEPPGLTWDEQHPCHPVCEPPCHDGEICVEPGRCVCGDGAAREDCETRQHCALPNILHGTVDRLASSEGTASGTVRCDDQYRLPSGEQQTSFQCLNGTWYFSGLMSGHKMVKCYPLCSPSCVNYGTCVAPGQCLCSAGFSGKYCEMRPTTTTDGMRCVFPFSDDHKMHSSCVIGEDKRPWCPTQVNLDRKPLAWQICNSTDNLERVVGTISGRTCSFPFKWNGTTWWKCAHDDQGRYWCPTHVTTDGKILHADFCWLDHGLPHIQPECHSVLGCPVPDILGAPAGESPFLRRATIDSANTTTNTSYETSTIVTSQAPDVSPLVPIHQSPPQQPSLTLMPLVPPAPPPMQPPILVLEKPVPAPVPQPVPVFMQPALHPQPVLQLAPLVAVHQLPPLLPGPQLAQQPQIVVLPIEPTQPPPLLLTRSQLPPTTVPTIEYPDYDETGEPIARPKQPPPPPTQPPRRTTGQPPRKQPVTEHYVDSAELPPPSPQPPKRPPPRSKRPKRPKQKQKDSESSEDGLAVTRRPKLRRPKTTEAPTERPVQAATRKQKRKRPRQTKTRKSKRKQLLQTRKQPRRPKRER